MRSQTLRMEDLYYLDIKLTLIFTKRLFGYVDYKKSYIGSALQTIWTIWLRILITSSNPQQYCLFGIIN